MNSSILLQSVTKKYGAVKAVDAIDLSVRPGECLALVGHNGAGKSTLIKMVLGLIRPTSGSVCVLGQDPMADSFNAIRKNIGFLPEQVLFQNNMTGRETLEFYARLKGVETTGLEALFHRVDLAQAADNRISTYSKGMRQRLGLAQSLIGAPGVLILDEPTSGLDPASRQNVYSIINEAKQAGATVLISSHALTELDDRIDRIAILNRGILSALGTISELRRNIGLNSEIRVEATPTSLQALAQHYSKKEGSELNEKYLINGVASLSCPTDDKASFLKDLMALDIDITNIEVNDPSLEQVYMAYTSEASLKVGGV